MPGVLPITTPPTSPTSGGTTGIVLADIPSDANSIYANPDGTGIFQKFLIRNHYEKDKKIYQMGVCSPSGFNGSSVAFVQIASPTLLWICDWVVARVGTQPIIPDPQPEVSSWVLLDEWYDPEEVRVEGADGVQPSFMISGVYVYGHTNPASNTNANIVYPITPWIDASLVTSSFRTVPDALLTKGLIDTLTNLISKPIAPITGGVGSSNAGGASGQGLIQQ